MLGEIIKPIEKELHTVNNIVEKEMYIKSAHIGRYAHLELTYSERVIRPALVILSARIYGYTGEKAQYLASIFQFTHLASIVHKFIPEKDTDYIRGIPTPGTVHNFPFL